MFFCVILKYNGRSVLGNDPRIHTHTYIYTYIYVCYICRVCVDPDSETRNREGSVYLVLVPGVVKAVPIEGLVPAHICTYKEKRVRSS